jgi:hypothetical protein
MSLEQVLAQYPGVKIVQTFPYHFTAQHFEIKGEEYTVSFFFDDAGGLKP